jgi:hypothetical protein
MRRLGVGLAVAAVVALLVGGAVTALGGWPGRPDAAPVREVCQARTDAGAAALDVEQAGNAALIAAVGQRVGMSPRAVTIALATAMQESKLRNIDYGDRDSLGLFQQRPSQDWGTPEQIMDPLYSAAEFYRELAKVPGFETMAVTEAAQAVQRSAYPEAYAQHEGAARSFASALTGHSPAALTCELAPAADRSTPAGFLGALRAEWGDAAGDQALASEPAQDQLAEGGQVVIKTGDETRAWAEAAWAVATASQLGIASVQVGGQVWNRSAGEWSQLDAASGEPAGTVTVVLA